MTGLADNVLVEALMVALLAIGSFFVLVGSFGLVKLSEFFKRLHGPTKATTLGVGCIMVASIGWHALLGDGLGLRELLITLFLFITAPVSAHLLAKTGLHLQLRHEDNTRGNPPELRDEEIGEKPVPHPDRGHG